MYLATQKTENLTPSIFLKITQCFFIYTVLVALIGCTTLVAHTSIDPYVSDNNKMGQLESLAASYCREKQLAPKSTQSIVMPDYQFTTDGCSRWFDESWVSCCVVHDILYWCGGSAEDRKEADKIMMQCANQKAALMGGIMYPGVRIGGSPWLPTPWRWGYGWKKWPKGYQKTARYKTIKNILNKLHIPEAVEGQLK